MLLTEYFVLLSHHGLCEGHINPEAEKKIRVRGTEELYREIGLFNRTIVS